MLSASGTVVKAESRCARLAPPLRSRLAGWSVPRFQEGGVDPESELCLCSHGEAPGEFPALKSVPGAGLGGSQLPPTRQGAEAPSPALVSPGPLAHHVGDERVLPGEDPPHPGGLCPCCLTQLWASSPALPVPRGGTRPGPGMRLPRCPHPRAFRTARLPCGDGTWPWHPGSPLGRGLEGTRAGSCAVDWGAESPGGPGVGFRGAIPLSAFCGLG